MEFYLFFAFLLFYMITALILDEKTKEKVWLIAFIVSFVATSIAIVFIKASRQDVMMNAEQLNWYYFLYLFGIVSVVLGLFNLWIYRKEVWKIVFGKKEDD